MPRRKDADEVFCGSCGNAIKQEAELCPECGTRNEQSTAGRRPPSGRARDDPFEDLAQSTGDDDLVAQLAPYVAWVSGVFLILGGIGTLTGGGNIVRALVGGSIILATGAFVLPIVRDRFGPQLRDKGMPMSRRAVTTIVLVAFFIGVSIAPV
ncbi:zinc ribbon domain-containing protein [Haladaptatus halobius]|uniref:zinc ribbon domain-containing protein n=1 Tax=Haladaptatus halobius TaxID=2884875 RepID=UPI001D0AFC4E|nr:zinc ribbon domain-containing protein [Haladaptatus halobius]